MNILKNLLECLLNTAKSSNRREGRVAMFNQAFGAAMCYSFFHPELNKAVEDLWNEVYKPEFEHIIY